MSCMHMLVQASSKKVIKSIEKPKLKMERRNVYSRAYHKEACRTGLASKARTFANLEVKKWEATCK